MSNIKLTIGIIGTIGAGKGIIGNYLIKNYGFYKITMGNIVRAVARKQGVEINRENLQKLGKEMRQKYGNDYYINLVVEKAQKSKMERILIDGVRTYDDATVSKAKLNATILLVDARPEIRFKRLQKRGRKGFAKTYEQFEVDEKNEPGYRELAKTLKHVNYRLDNSGTRQELYKRIDDLMSRLIKK